MRVNNFIIIFSINIKKFPIKIKYVFNNIINFTTYNFRILPYIIYNTNNINITFKQNYTSELPSVYPYDGIFLLEKMKKEKFYH